MELNSKQDRGVIMYSDLSGENVKPFFNQMKDCSCPFMPVIRPVFTIDNTNRHNPTIYWISLEGHLHESDIDGCFCNLVIVSEELLSPSSLTVDKKNIYWSNTKTEKLYLVNKIHPNKEGIKKYHSANVNKIKAFGKSLQPYPDSECFTFSQTDYNIQEISKTKNSIKIKMPQPIFHEICDNYNLPSTLYTIYYSECLEENKCSEEIKLQTYDAEMEIEKLKSFTKYRFRLALSNYYNSNENFSSEIILQTEVGIPSRPRNVTVKSLTPTTAAVYWLPSEILNANYVNYKTYWTPNTINGRVKKTSGIIEESGQLEDGRHFAILHHMLPNQEYKIFVRAYPPNFIDNHNESIEQYLKMYPEPNNLTVEYFTTALTIFWSPDINLTVDYSLEFTSLTLNKWQIVNISKIINNTAEFHIINLEPKTSYKFRLMIKYPDSKEQFIWPNDNRFIFETLGKKKILFKSDSVRLNIF